MNYLAVKELILDRLAEELPQTLLYHGRQHTIQVLNSVELIAEYENIRGDKLTILKTAALCHDLGFIYQYSNNEEIACMKITEFLPSYDYSQKQIQIICSMIRATAIPQSPHSDLDKILCDADLFYLGTSTFSTNSESLRLELEAHKSTFSDHKWLSYQISFLEKHHFFTGYAQANLEETKQNNIKQIRARLNLHKQ